MEIQLVSNKEEFRQILENNEELFLLKHSLTCPISGAASNQFNRFHEESTVPCFVVHVQEARDLCNHIAEITGIRHESPQVIQFQKGQPVWHDSHSAITKDRLMSI